MRKVDDKPTCIARCRKKLKKTRLQVNTNFNYVQKRIDTCSINSTAKDKITCDLLKRLNSNEETSSSSNAGPWSDVEMDACR